MKIFYSDRPSTTRPENQNEPSSVDKQRIFPHISNYDAYSVPEDAVRGTSIYKSQRANSTDIGTFGTAHRLDQIGGCPL